MGAHRYGDEGPLRPSYKPVRHVAGAHPRWNQNPVAGEGDRRFVYRAGLRAASGTEERGPHLRPCRRWLWHLLTKDNAAVRVQPDPKGDVTDAGADGFTVYKNTAGELRFRLWESKKNTGSGSLSTSLNTAYKQIADSGQRYVAKIVGTFTPESSDDEMLAFMAEVPAAWTQGAELVGAGVTLATHQPLPGQPFKKMSRKLPLLDKPGQLRGLATSISCFNELAKTVRRYAWTAL